MEKKCCAICEGYLTEDGVCLEQQEHWRYRKPEAFQRAIEILQSRIAETTSQKNTADPLLIEQTREYLNKEYLDKARKKK